MTKLQSRLSLLREEYIRLQGRLAKAEHENAVLKATTASEGATSSGGGGGGTGSDSHRSFVSKLLETTANLYNNPSYRYLSKSALKSILFYHKLSEGSCRGGGG